MKKSIELSWQKIISAIIIAILLGMLSWFGATLRESLADLEELKSWKVETQTIINTDLEHTLEQLEKSIEENSAKIGSLSAETKKLEILINRLEVIVERLEK